MPRLSAKHVQINKANSTVLAFTAMAVVIVVFGIFTGKAILSVYSHQEKVIEAKSISLKRLDANIEARNQIVESYREFADPTKATNIIGGNIAGEGDKDGDNARIILDALPSKYDFPALTTSLENLLSRKGFTVAEINGIDDEINQSTLEATSEPAPVEINVGIKVEGADYDGTKTIVNLLHKSIRPFYVNEMIITGSENGITINLELKTFFQPEKAFVIQDKVIK